MEAWLAFAENVKSGSPSFQIYKLVSTANQTKSPLNTLILEDSEDAALALVDQLGRGGYDVSYKRAWTAAQMGEALLQGPWDIIISDYYMPGFNGLEALSLMKATGLDIPFIIVSGRIGEDLAVAAMKAGASDYVMKENLARLAPAVERELRDAKDRQRRRVAEEALKESEARFRQVAENVDQVFWLTDTKKNQLLYISPAYEQIWGRTCDSLYQEPRGWLEAIHPGDRDRVFERAEARPVQAGYDETYRIVRPDGATRWV